MIIAIIYSIIVIIYSIYCIAKENHSLYCTHANIYIYIHVGREVCVRTHTYAHRYLLAHVLHPAVINRGWLFSMFFPSRYVLFKSRSFLSIGTQKGCAIINISSVNGLQSFAGCATYCASKVRVGR